MLAASPSLGRDPLPPPQSDRYLPGPGTRTTSLDEHPSGPVLVSCCDIFLGTNSKEVIKFLRAGHSDSTAVPLLAVQLYIYGWINRKVPSYAETKKNHFFPGSLGCREAGRNYGFGELFYRSSILFWFRSFFPLVFLILFLFVLWLLCTTVRPVSKTKIFLCQKNTVFCPNKNNVSPLKWFWNLSRISFWGQKKLFQFLSPDFGDLRKRRI